MTARFKIALATLIGLAATAVVVALLLGVFDAPKTNDADEIADEGTQPGTVDPDAPLTPDGDTTPEDGPGLDGAGDPNRTGTMGPGLRDPHGLDLSDPEQLNEHLASLIENEPVDWKELVRTLKVATGALSDEVKAFLLKSLRFGPRNHASRAFRVVQDGSLAQELLTLLDDPELDPRGNLAVLKALYEMPGADADQVSLGLEGRLSDDFAKDRYVIQAIAARGGPEAARALVEYIQRMEKPGLMNPYLIQALDLRTNKDAQQVVIDALQQSDFTPAALRQVLSMVKQPGATAFTESVIRLDIDSQPQEVRVEALQALGKIGGTDAIDYLLAKAAQPGVYGEHATKAFLNVNHLEPKDQKRLADELDAAGRNPRPDDYRIALLRALANVRASDIGEKVAPLINDPSKGVSHAAIQAIGRMQKGGEKYVPKLVERWGSADDATKIRLAVALGTIGGEGAVKALETMAQEKDHSPHLLRTLRMGLNDAKKRLEKPEERAATGDGGLVGQAAPGGGIRPGGG
ncbi:MAG: HEAT repeat domain-containing protein [Planctomycetota bacterium]|nr:HEAT repeat domain-containing protein [Planctomycetota bacterium]